MELNLIAYDEDNIIASYILDNIPLQDVEQNYTKNELNIFIFNSEQYKNDVKKLYDVMLKRSPASKKYDVRIKKMIIFKVLDELVNLSDFDELCLKYKKLFKFNLYGDVVTDYKFLSECSTIKNILDFCETYKNYQLGLAYLKSLS